MIMDNLPEDQKVVDLLTKLKNTNGKYPPDMLSARRRTYLKQMANVGLGIGVGTGLKDTLKGGANGSSAAATAGSKILETVLIAAIAIEAGTATYLYREKIANAIRFYMGAPTAQEVSSSSNETSSTQPTLIATIATPSATLTETPTGTALTSVADGNNQSNNNTSVNATPNPGGNQGNQYGLTPKPVRTKEDNSGSGSSNNNNTDGSGGGGNSNGGGGTNNRP